MSNIIDVTFKPGASIADTSGLWQYDYGQILRFAGIDLPQAYEVHFANEGDPETFTVIGDENGVAIPDALLLTGKSVVAWVYLHTGLEDGETEYRATLFVQRRAKPSDLEPTPVEQSAIDQAIAALNVAVEQTGADAITTGENANRAESAADRAETASGSAGDDAERAETAARAAAASEQNAGTSASNAALSATAANISAQDAARDADRAEQAAANAGYMWIDMDANGHLVYERTDAVDVDFELDDGHLIMEAV